MNPGPARRRQPSPELRAGGPRRDLGGPQAPVVWARALQITPAMQSTSTKSSTADFPAAYRLTVRGTKGNFLEVELAIDDGLLAVDLVLTVDALRTLSEKLSAPIAEAGSVPPRRVAEDASLIDEDEEQEVYRTPPAVARSER